MVALLLPQDKALRLLVRPAIMLSYTQPQEPVWWWLRPRIQQTAVSFPALLLPRGEIVLLVRDRVGILPMGLYSQKMPVSLISCLGEPRVPQQNSQYSI